MFNKINNSGVSHTFGKFTGTTRSRAMAAAIAVVTAASAGRSFGAISTITSVTTQLTTGTPTKVSGLTGVGAQYSQFQAPSTFNVTYANDDQKLTSVTANGVTYNATGLASTVVERGTAVSGNYTDTIWEMGTNSGSSISLQGTVPSSVQQAFSGNNFLMGADNIFANTGNSVGDNTNIDRLDMIFTGGVKASTSAAFAVFDRGTTTDHDSFKIAAITAINAQGVPTNYGPLISLADGTWGQTALVPTQEEVIVRKNDSSGSTAPFDPSDSTAQTIGGVLIPTSSLVTAGTTIYGYSLFGADVTGTGTELTQYTNTAYFPMETATSTTGGLDPLATTGVLFTTSPVPEPTSLAIAGVATAGLLGRRPKKNKPENKTVTSA
jgi:hypothetical protein